MDLILHLAQPLGNVIAKYVFRNKIIEEDSMMSDVMGILAIMGLIALLLWMLLSVQDNAISQG